LVVNDVRIKRAIGIKVKTKIEAGRDRYMQPAKSPSKIQFIGLKEIEEITDKHARTSEEKKNVKRISLWA